MGPLISYKFEGLQKFATFEACNKLEIALLSLGAFRDQEDFTLYAKRQGNRFDQEFCLPVR